MRLPLLMRLWFSPSLIGFTGVKESWLGRTGVAVLPRGGIGSPQGVLVTLQGCKMQNAVLFTQDHRCMVESHILREVTVTQNTADLKD